ncbi:hypothetical protein N5923_20350 [Erwiniaceae bacterium BAC15a-03b]|uniref:Uncharacterized protein n=1 Tax=Winslowiella arboricola TaxID=2978220 RepID=A0A9J6PVW1_9GAMM|nr:hypothetical protein [Winslowiella arboricola]MCU5772276.1 hypothetical protein [Winslowiella arboricola]MCU5779845.1 hypothetical protein [Winslowiella arboricola]
MTYPKRLLILPALAVAALLAWWLKPGYDTEDEAYYVAVFCTIRHDDSSRFIADMQNVIEGGNSDYALHKIAFIPALGKAVTASWQQLTPAAQHIATNDEPSCQRLMSAQLQAR